MDKILYHALWCIGIVIAGQCAALGYYWIGFTMTLLALHRIAFALEKG